VKVNNVEKISDTKIVLNLLNKNKNAKRTPTVNARKKKATKGG